MSMDLWYDLAISGTVMGIEEEAAQLRHEVALLLGAEDADDQEQDVDQALRSQR